MRTYIAVAVMAALAVSGVACQTQATTPVPAPATTTPVAKATTPPTVTPAKPADDPWMADKPKERHPLAHPLFWSAEKGGKTTYFLGTMHVGVDAEVQMPDVVWQKLDAAPAFAMETDTSQVDLGSMVRRDGGTLRQDLGEEYWKKFEAAATPQVARGVDKMKPMVAATMLEMKLLPSTPPMDGVLQAHAINGKKDIVYLEPVAKQSAILEKWMTVRVVKMMLDHQDEAKEHTKAMLASYVAGDVDAIVKQSDDERDWAKAAGFTDKELDQETEELLYERNASWIDGLEKLHQRGNAFVAVGAMHLAGKRSVLELLAAKGYTIKRVQP